MPKPLPDNLKIEHVSIDPVDPNNQETQIMPIADETVEYPNADVPVTENSPAITLPQKVAALIGGIPILANLTSSFGIWAPNEAQIKALEESANYGWKVALVIAGPDAIIRFARNIREGQKAKATANVVAAQHYAAAQEASITNHNSIEG